MRSVIFLFSLVLVVSACKNKGGDESASDSPSPSPSPTDSPTDNKGASKPSTGSENVSDDDANSLPEIQLVAGNNYNCALLRSSGAIKCWGESDLYQLGQMARENIGDEANEMGDQLSAIKLGGGQTAKAISVGISHTCAILSDDTVKCWGYGRKGRLGQGNEHLIGDEAEELEKMATVDLGKDCTAKAVGWGHTSALLDNDTVKCWGSGDNGKLGSGEEDDLGDGKDEMGNNLPIIDFGNSRTAKAISAGGYHTCAILSDNNVKCWGSGNDGKLGQESTDHIGDEEDEVKDMPVVDLGNGRTAKAISAGGGHTCAILDDDTVKCWGSGMTGKLGYGNLLSRGDESDEMGDELPVVNLGAGRKAKSISAGGNNTCVVLDNNTAKCWGGGGHGTLGMGNTDRIGDNSGEMEALKPINFGKGRTVKTITAGGSYVCALLDDNAIKCLGYGYHGQLGSGKTDNLGDNSNEVGDGLPTVDLGF